MAYSIWRQPLPSRRPEIVKPAPEHGVCNWAGPRGCWGSCIILFNDRQGDLIWGGTSVLHSLTSFSLQVLWGFNQEGRLRGIPKRPSEHQILSSGLAWLNSSLDTDLGGSGFHPRKPEGSKEKTALPSTPALPSLQDSAAGPSAYYSIDLSQRP